MEMMQGLIVDNFAGGGGASTGLEWAFNRPVDFAINHDADAVAMHMANHPDTEHICQSVWKADPLEVTGGREVALAWFSPDCKHFSKAKGGKPVEKGIRDLAWVVVSWAKRVRPKVIMLENVEEFRQWCPVDEDGRPIDGPGAEQLDMLAPTPAERRQKRKTKANGATFELWCAALRKEGYDLEWKELRGCDYGAPTIRKRLFVIARCDGQPIVWPEPTHGPAGSDGVKAGELLPYKTAASHVIDWSIPCPSIFERDRPLAENTLKRIAAGIMRFVVNNPAPFIVPVCHSKGGSMCHPGDEPLRTVTTAKGGELAVVAPTLVHTAHGETNGKGFKRGRGFLHVKECMPTTTSKGSVALTAATLIHRGNGERKGQAPRIYDVTRPLGTAVAGGVKHGVVEVDLEKAHKVAAFMAQHQGESRGRVREGRAADLPAGTIVHRGTQQNLVVAHLEQANGGPRNKRLAGRAADAPLATATTAGSQQRLVTTHLTTLRGTCRDGRPATEPHATVTAGGLHAAEVRAFLVKYFGTAIGQPIDEPAHTATTKERFGLVTVTIAGEEYVIVDIGMRMLSARELARAQGFPDDYKLDPVTTRTDRAGRSKTGPLPKTAQVRMIGNSVNPQVAAALVAVNCQAQETRAQEVAA